KTYRNIPLHTLLPYNTNINRQSPKPFTSHPPKHKQTQENPPISIPFRYTKLFQNPLMSESNYTTLQPQIQSSSMCDFQAILHSILAMSDDLILKYHTYCPHPSALLRRMQDCSPHSFPQQTPEPGCQVHSLHSALSK